MRTLLKHAVPLALLLATTVAMAEAAPLRSAAQTKPEELFNPAAAPDDILLPMPCDMVMVLKAVDIPVRGLLWDARFNMGSNTPAESGLEFHDRRFSAVLSAPFTAKDIPQQWHAAIKPSDEHTYYFMAKYELSAGQWEAVMGNACPAPSPENASPKTGISWYDAQEFTRKYTQWLLDNAPDSLPRFAGDERNTGFVRLPTEAEWEYAARGGSRVRQETLMQEAFHPLESGTTLTDYAVFRSEGAVQEGPLRIGSRRPNPLGLYDVAGNVAEMVQDAFRFSLGGRLHGASGGFVRKGGSFASSSVDIEPGRREEVALFNARGPVSSTDMGLRVALSGINTPGGERAEALLNQWKKLGAEAEQIAATPSGKPEAPKGPKSPTPSAPPSSPTPSAPPSAPPPVPSDGTALVQLDTLLGWQNLDPATRETLSQLRSRLKDDSVQLERQYNASTENTLRSMLYLSETIRNFGVRRDIALKRLKEVQAINAMSDKDLTTKMPGLTRKDVAKYLRGFTADVAEMYACMEAGANFYRGQMDDLMAMPAAMVNYNLQLIREEQTGEDYLTRNTLQNLNNLEKHLNLLRAGSTAKLTKAMLIRDILPDNLEKDL